MKWKKISQYAIESECKVWRISKSFIDGCTLYCLHDRNGNPVKYAEDVEDCKAIAERGGK